MYPGTRTCSSDQWLSILSSAAGPGFSDMRTRRPLVRLSPPRPPALNASSSALAQIMALSSKKINNPSFLDDLGSIAPVGSEQKVPRMIRKFQRNVDTYTNEVRLTSFIRLRSVLADVGPCPGSGRACENQTNNDKNRNLKPPLMHYGWIADERKLYQYALAHNLVALERLHIR